MPTPRRSAVLWVIALLSLGGFSACKPATESAPASAAPAAALSGAVTPDMSDSRCTLIPPEQVQEYKRVHEIFTSAPGLVPLFEQGQLFRYEEEIRFQWDQASAQPLTVEISLLQRCSQSVVHGSPLFETASGSGQIAAKLYTSNAGSSYPSGTPAVVRVQSTVVDMSTMTGKTTVIGEYTIRLEGPQQ